MIALLFYLSLICLVGIVISRSILSKNHFEIILPVGIILGLSIYTFILNLVSFVFKGPPGIITSLLFTIFLGFIFLFKQRQKNSIKLNFKFFFLWLISVLGWAGLIIWKTENALIGSDANLYYAIAYSFVKGNFPFLTPWQPDIPLSYHVGTAELLGAFYFFTGLDFRFLHLFFSALFIFCASQVLIWIMEKRTLINFLLGNIATAVVFISFGHIYLTWPIFPLKFPSINNINQLILWFRGLPTVNQAIEVYGAPINLDALIYFIFHAFGLAIFLSLIVLLLNYKKEKFLSVWIVIGAGLAVLALVNESIFIAAFPALSIGLFISEYKAKTLIKNLKKLLLVITITVLIIVFQGGMITASLNPQSVVEKSALIFPKKEEVKDDFRGYHLGQSESRLLPIKDEWMPLRWFYPGVIFLFTLSLLTTFVIKTDFNYSLLLKVLFIGGFASLIAYDVIVPKFLVANGNRFLSFSILSFSLILCLALIHFFEKFRKSFKKKTLLSICLAFIFIPTILPPLALLSKNRFSENKLIPKTLQSSQGILWLKKNANFYDRVIVLDRNAPHPSGQVRALVEAGVFAPVFYGNFRVFTIEASPEYIDIAYYLSPEALRKMKISTLLIDHAFFGTLPEKRKQQLEDRRYFIKVFDNSNISSEWEKIYQIQDEYLTNGEELDGTFAQMIDTISFDGKVYIDNEEAFEPSFLRRSIIFSVRDKELYYKPQSGVYLNVEAYINWHPVEEGSKFNYMVLGKNTDPKDFCMCEVKLIWTGLKGQIVVWKRI